MSTPFIIGHRGACGDAPENTLTSIRRAAEKGALWVEFDTMLSADNQVILFHDDSLLRTTGTDALVADTDWRDLQKLDAGSWFSDQFTGEKIPLFSEAIDLLEELGLGSVVEIKPSEGRDEETARLSAQMIKDHWPAVLPTPIISSFNEDALRVVRDCVPDIPRALNVWKTIEGWQGKVQSLGCVALHSRHELLDETTASAIINAGYDLRAFTVNDPEQAHILSNWGVISIFTDFPDRF
ncbi:MAG: glycerophosphoryl diester phosphodiesterase [Rhodospirillaceae bacterium]|nr:glycerophosphoryl diester phosphodiesterase [Rhodospirillaceae bacterium]MBL6930900.1 glycerophosphoryl diester phosphodiesterase [Rhodospirillales bacterium]MBL6942414.1 glycerophosphoryl diester phosphodiesterase [Rhodospirillales bacterium]